MAFYTDNRFANASDDFNIQVEAATGYDGALGCQFAYIESVQESQDIFETALRNDFEEAYAAHSMNESAVIAIQEGGIRDMWDKIVEFFKNLWKKIKGIFLGFEAKFRSVFVKSNKEFVKKYLPLLRKKDFTDFKVKCDLAKKEISLKDGSGLEATFDVKNAEDKIDKDYDSDEERCKFANKFLPELNLSSFKDLKKEFRDVHFDGPEVKDEKDINIMQVCNNLESSEKDLDNAKKAYNNLEKNIKNIIKKINTDIKNIPLDDDKETVRVKSYSTSKDSNKREEELSFNITNNGIHDIFNKNPNYSIKGKEANNKYSKTLSYIHKQATDYQAVVTGLSACVIDCIKYKASQERKVVAAAVAYKGHKNYTEYGESVDLSSQEYLNAIMEAEQYDIDIAFESFDD